MKIKPINNTAVNLYLQKNYMRSVKDPETGLETYIKDTGAYKVSISNEAFKLALKEGVVEKLLPKQEQKEVFVTNKKA